jgi:hypothetical protein
MRLEIAVSAGDDDVTVPRPTEIHRFQLEKYYIPTTSYDKKNMAVDIHELTSSLGFDWVSIVGHDIGLMVAYVTRRSSHRAPNVWC